MPAPAPNMPAIGKRPATWKTVPIVLFVCQRGNDDGPRCPCGNRSTEHCASWTKSGAVCSRPLCRDCAQRNGAFSFCSAHARIASAR